MLIASYDLVRPLNDACYMKKMVTGQLHYLILRFVPTETDGALLRQHRFCRTLGR